jgi:hypothetical protein
MVVMVILMMMMMVMVMMASGEDDGVDDGDGYGDDDEDDDEDDDAIGMQPSSSSPRFLGLSSFTLRKGGRPVIRYKAMPTWQSDSICLWPQCRPVSISKGDAQDLGLSQT